VKPFTGRPSFWGRLKGESPHPTPEAKMSEMYDPRIYAEQQKFFHGTSMQFLKSIVDRGKMPVHPEAAAVRGTRGVESSLFLSEPGTPYTTFATPETIIRIGKGAATKEVRSSTLEQLMTGQLTQQQRLASGLKDVKASGELKSLISKRGALQRELAELEKSTTADISPKRMKTEAELYDTMRKIDKLVADEYGKATGERVRITEEPGAFLMVEETPVRPSATIIEKAMRREALRASEKKGTITKEQIKELRRLERELQKESIREYFDTPVGTVFPSPKPTWGYEWKGIPEAEFTMRAGSELYPMTSVRSQLYARFGITKGTHFVHDPYTGRWMEVLKVSPTPTAASTKPPIIDIPELLYPIKKGIETLTKPKLTAKQKSELIRIDKEIEKAATDLDYRRVGELQNRRRTILYGDRIRGMYLPKGTMTRSAGRLQGRFPDIVAKTPYRMLGRLPDRVSTVPPPLTPPTRTPPTRTPPTRTPPTRTPPTRTPPTRTPPTRTPPTRTPPTRTPPPPTKTPPPPPPTKTPPPPPPTKTPPPPPPIKEDKHLLRKRRKHKPEYWQIRNPIANLQQMMFGRVAQKPPVANKKRIDNLK